MSLRPVRLLTALLLAVLLLVPAGLAAQQPAAGETPLRERGCCLSQVRDGATIEDLDIEGNDALASSTIKNAIFTTGSGWLPWGEDYPLNKSEFLKDLERIYVLYQRHGYFDAELASYTVTPKGDDGVAIQFTVREGQPTTVDTLAIEVLDAIDGEELEQELRGRIPLSEGERFNEADLLASRDALESEFQNRGYAFAQVLMEYRIRKETQSAAVAYTVVPGDIFYIGDVRIEGYEGEDDTLIRRQLAFNRGDAYDLQDIRTSQRRIYELALFRRVDIEPQLAELREDTVDVEVTVLPAPTHVVRLGVGYGTEDLLRVRASWLDRSLLGDTQQLEVRGEYSRLDRQAAVTYRQPFLLIPDLNYAATAFLRFETEPNYTVERLGATTRVGYRISPDFDSSASLTAEQADFSDFDRGILIPELGRDFIDPSQLLYAAWTGTFDNTDSLFSPTRGMTIRPDYQIGLPVSNFDYAYHRLTLLATRYLEVREGWVVAGKVLPGVIYTYRGDPEQGGEGRVPLFQRLFAGGSTSVRGYERRQLGPKDNPGEFGQERNPEPIGGSALFEMSIELRFPLRGKFRGAAFVDAGNVWDSPSDFSLTDLKVTPGVGVRYATPVGPIRLDVARRTSGDEPFLPGWVFHISIGNAF